MRHRSAHLAGAALVSPAASNYRDQECFVFPGVFLPSW
jgi:hypothetical protein